jgi:hypothetical protein
MDGHKTVHLYIETIYGINMKKIILTIALLFLTTFAFAARQQSSTDFVSAPTVSGTAVQYGAINLAGGATEVTNTLPIGNGGTGQTTAQTAIDALLPAQGSSNGKFLTSNGSSSSWGTPAVFTSQAKVFTMNWSSSAGSGSGTKTGIGFTPVWLHCLHPSNTKQGWATSASEQYFCDTYSYTNPTSGYFFVGGAGQDYETFTLTAFNSDGFTYTYQAGNRYGGNGTFICIVGN